MIREGRQLPKDTSTRVPEIVKALEVDPDIIALYAFGSFATGALKPLSDLDFGVVLNERIEKKQRFEKHIELIGLFSDTFSTDAIDLVVMNDAPIRISFQILKTGKLLLCNNTPALTDYHERLVQKYLDFKCMKDAFDAVFLEGIGYHG